MEEKEYPAGAWTGPIHGTPVIDIKPISPSQEFLKKPRVPKWYDQLWQGA